MSKRDRENLLRGLVWIGVECRTALAELGDCGNDPKVDYSTVNAACRECATAAGFVPKDKIVGVWLGECGICHERKPCTNLHHDWRRKKEGGDRYREDAKMARQAREMMFDAKRKSKTATA